MGSVKYGCYMLLRASPSMWVYYNAASLDDCSEGVATANLYEHYYQPHNALSLQVAVLVSGLILTVATGLASWYMKRIFEATAVRKRSGESRSRSRSAPSRS